MRQISKYVFLSLFSLVMVSCGGKGENKEGSKPKNKDILSSWTTYTSELSTTFIYDFSNSKFADINLKPSDATVNVTYLDKTTGVVLEGKCSVNVAIAGSEGSEQNSGVISVWSKNLSSEHNICEVLFGLSSPNKPQRYKRVDENTLSVCIIDTTSCSIWK
jgi:hypothetical protein